MLGFTIVQTPFNYIGVPIFEGKARSHHIQIRANRILAKPSTWKFHLLSMMGRV